MITIDYFSDVLCVWAYAGQVRLETLQRDFSDDVLVRQRFMNLFGDTEARIGKGWEKGGFTGFGEHMRELCAQWEHTHLHSDVWTHCRPRSCTTAHVFLRAVAVCLGLDDAGDDDPAARAVFDTLVAQVRLAFFEHAADIGDLAVLKGLLTPTGVSPAAVSAQIDNGSAYAALQRDAELMASYGVQGSPTFVFNEGRQLLYGNVGYRIIESNVRELLSAKPIEGAPSWC